MWPAIHVLLPRATCPHRLEVDVPAQPPQPDPTGTAGLDERNRLGGAQPDGGTVARRRGRRVHVTLATGAERRLPSASDSFIACVHDVRRGLLMQHVALSSYVGADTSSPT